VPPRCAGWFRAMSQHLDWFERLSSTAVAEVEAAFYAKTAQAEAARLSETAAAVKLQATWRGRTTRILHAYWTEHSLLVERVSRGHLGRQKARRARIERDLLRQRAYFDVFATQIQLRFRGFHSRKYLHNFYARKAYVTAVVQKGDEVRSRLQQRLEEQVAEKTSEQEATGRETVLKLASRLHHLRSTASCAGIYNSAYHVGYHPTAFGVPVEEHLSNAIRPTIKKELAARGRTLKPVGSLPPIKPRNMHQATYGELERAERQERWLDKSARVGQEDFVTATGKLPLSYPGSVHVTNVADEVGMPLGMTKQSGVGYHPPPASLERGADKTRWVDPSNNFKPAVPTNRLVDPARMTSAMPTVVP